MDDNSSNQNGPPVTYNYTQEIPIKNEHRTCTDVFCTIVGLLFSVVMIILGITYFNWDNYVKSNFPTDSDGNLCGVDVNGYNYVYFANAPQIDRRVCVRKCPASTDSKLDCYMTNDVGCKYKNNTGFQVLKYNNFAYDGGRVGSFCFPQDDTIRQKLMDNGKLDNRVLFINSLDTIVSGLFLALVISIIYVIFVQCFPRVMNFVVPYLSLVVLFALSVCLFLYYWDAPGKTAVAITLLIGFLVVLLGLIRNRHSLPMNGVFLNSATNMLRFDKCLTFAYIPLFIAFLVGFIFIILMQFRSFWAGSSLYFEKNESLFWQFNATGPQILCIFLIIQAIWGLSFLKQAFNFIVSGNVVSWYYGTNDSFLEPLKILLTKHFGTVVGGSFMTGFFTIGDILFDLIKPKISSSSKQSLYKRTHSWLCSPCKKLFDLVRSDAMGYTYITGNPYCNSARYCQYLSDHSAAFEDTQSTSRIYRISAHLLISGLVGIICLYIKGKIVATVVLVIIFSSLFISTFFISIHADAAQAISVSFIDNQECEKRRLNLPQWLGHQTWNKMQMKKPDLAEEIRKTLEEHPYRERAQ